MKILVTGGAGFIGSSLIPELTKFGHEIHVIDNLSFGSRKQAKVSDQFFSKVDLREKSEVEKIFNEFKPDWILHLAALHFVPYCNKNPIETIDVNVNGTLNLLNITRKSQDLKGIFFASTATFTLFMI